VRELEDYLGQISDFFGEEERERKDGGVTKPFRRIVLRQWRGRGAAGG